MSMRINCDSWCFYVQKAGGDNNFSMVLAVTENWFVFWYVCLPFWHLIVFVMMFLLLLAAVFIWLSAIEQKIDFRRGRREKRTNHLTINSDFYPLTVKWSMD